MNRATIRNNLRELGDDYLLEYGDIEVSCVSTGPESAHIGHFEVPADRRGSGVGSAIMEELVETLRDDGYSHLRARIAVTETDSFDDPTVRFLKKHGFSGFRFEDHPDWGVVVHGQREL